MSGDDKMINEKALKKILDNHERRISQLEGKRTFIKKGASPNWYKPGSTIEKIISLVNGGFFDKAQKIANIVSELKNRDFHLKAPDLTLPLRKIVRKGILKRTKVLPDGIKAKKWHYIKD